MPGGDRTGPAGLGPMTGRAAGFCAGYSVPGYANPIGGGGYGGWGRDRGGGFGRRSRFYAAGPGTWGRPGLGYPAWVGAAEAGAPYAGAFAPPANQEQEIEELKRQAEFLQDTLGQINKRLEQLETKDV